VRKAKTTGGGSIWPLTLFTAGGEGGQEKRFDLKKKKKTGSGELVQPQSYPSVSYSIFGGEKFLGVTEKKVKRSQPGGERGAQKRVTKNNGFIRKKEKKGAPHNRGGGGGGGWVRGGCGWGRGGGGGGGGGRGGGGGGGGGG